MTILFISDLHLCEAQPVLLQRLKELLQIARGRIDGLYILGDFFEAWIGDDLSSPFHKTVATELCTASEYFPIYLMPGNRDFLLGNAFYESSKAYPLADPSWLHFAGQEMLLLHGDSLATGENLYGAYRRLARSATIKQWFLNRSEAFRRHVAKFLMRNHGDDPNYARDISPLALDKLYQQLAPKIIIHGHTHYPLQQFQNEEIPFSRFVLGAWSATGNVLILRDSGQFEWLQFQNQDDLQQHL